MEAGKTEATPASTIKFGLLVQPQFQMQQSRYASATATADGWKNLYVRRTRLLVGGTIFGVFDYFFDTDFPNLGLDGRVDDGDGATMAGHDAEQLQGRVGDEHPGRVHHLQADGDMLKIDAGYMLPPLAHNAVQGATTLYAWDYFANSFRGLQLRPPTAAPAATPASSRTRSVAATPACRPAVCSWAAWSSTASVCSRVFVGRSPRPRDALAELLPGHRPRAGQPAGSRDRLLLPGHLPGHEEDPARSAVRSTSRTSTSTSAATCSSTTRWRTTCVTAQVNVIH